MSKKLSYRLSKSVTENFERLLKSGGYKEDALNKFDLYVTPYFNEKKKVEIRFRTGIESFDNNFRRNVYKKNILLDEKKIKELSEKIYSVCLLIATQGQTKEMIKNDIPKEKLFYVDEQSVVVNTLHVQEIIAENKITDSEIFKRRKQVVDIFKHISFVEGEK